LGLVLELGLGLALELGLVLGLGFSGMIKISFISLIIHGALSTRYNNFKNLDVSDKCATKIITSRVRTEMKNNQF
jgi:hypothetical protein